MECAPLPAPVQASLPDLARRLAIVLASLAAVVARRFLKDPRFFSIIIPLCTCITHAGLRFKRLTVRLAAGPLPKPHKSGRGGPHRHILPTGRGWLIRALGWEAAGYGSQLQFLLAEPAAVEFLALVPSARRILSPIGRMLGLAAFAPKPRTRKPRPRKPRARKPRARAPRAAARPCPGSTQFVHVPSAHWPWLPAPPRVRKPTDPALIFARRPARPNRDLNVPLSYRDVARILMRGLPAIPAAARRNPHHAPAHHPTPSAFTAGRRRARCPPGWPRRHPPARRRCWPSSPSCRAPGADSRCRTSPGPRRRSRSGTAAPPDDR